MRKHRCEDCNGIDLGSIHDKGDGICGVCEGKGFNVSITDAIANLVPGVDEFPPCTSCSEDGINLGDGICKTCDGSGYQSGESHEQETYNQISSNKNPDSYDGGGYGGSGSGGGGYTLSGDHGTYRGGPPRKWHQKLTNFYVGIILLIILILVLSNLKSCWKNISNAGSFLSGASSTIYKEVHGVNKPNEQVIYYSQPQQSLDPPGTREIIYGRKEVTIQLGRGECLQPLYATDFIGDTVKVDGYVTLVNGKKIFFGELPANTSFIDGVRSYTLYSPFGGRTIFKYLIYRC